jgi:hypothetical protein
MKKIYTILLFAGTFFGTNDSIAQTTYNDVAKIFYSKCTGCHHPGGSAPVSLMNYTVCSSNSTGIVADLNSGKMPPWLPDTAYGNVRFLHEQIISKADKDLILKWVTDGKLQGNPALAPAQPFYDDYAYKLCPTPTMVLKMKPRKIAHEAGSDCYPLKTNLTKARYLRAFEIVPGNAAIVNYVLAGVDQTGTLANDTTGNCLLPIVTSYVGAYSPNAAPTVWPGQAPLRAGMLIPANAQINLQIRYSDGSLGKYDSTQIRLYFYPDTATNVRNITTTSDINNVALLLFQNVVTTAVDSIAIDSNRSLLGIFPNAHGLCTSMHVDGIGQTPNIKLLNINKWDEEFANFYFYKKLVKFPSTYKLRASNVYDNTTANPKNPSNPPVFVTSYTPAGKAEAQLDIFQWLRYKTGDENIDMEALLKCDTLLVCKPGAAGIISGASTVCQGQTSITYSVSPIGNAATYTWAYSGSGHTIHGNSNVVTIDFNGNATAGNLTVKGVNTCGVSGTISANKVISVNNGVPIAAAGTITGTSSVCVNQTGVVYSLPTISGATGYTWLYSGTGATITGNTNSVTVNFSPTATSGNLTVAGTNTCFTGTVSPTYSITVNTIPATPTFTVVTNCGNSVLTASSTTGSYLWSPGGGTAQSITVTTGGTYSVTVSTGGGCSATSAGTLVTIKLSPSILPVSNNSRCGAGTVALGATASVGTINWYATLTNGASLATGTSYTTPSISTSTIYYVDATDNGCTSTPRTAVTATINNGATATLSGTTKVCKGTTGVLTIALTGVSPWAFTYGSSVGSNSVSNITTPSYTLAASVGTYTVGSVSDASGCGGSGSGNATVSENSTITASTPTLTCNGGKTAYTVDFDMSGGDVASYSITGAGSKTTNTHFTSSAITTGTAFSFSVTDTYHCAPVTTVSGGSPSCGCNASANISTTNGAICSGSKATITVTLGGTAPWSFIYAIGGVSQPAVTGITSSSYTFTTTTTGAYTLVSVTDANCTNTGVTGTATVSQTTVAANISGSGGICPGGSTNLTFDLTSGTAPWSFTYSNGTSNFGPISAITTPKQVSVNATGTYTLLSYTVGSCTGSGTGSAVITARSLPTISSSASPTGAICTGSSVTLIGAGAGVGGTYVWSDGKIDNQAFVINNAATYTVTGTDTYGCSGKAVRTINVNPLPVINPVSTPSSAAVCAGQDLILSGNGPLLYTWSGPETVSEGVPFKPTQNGLYTVSATDINGCTGTAIKGISVLPLPTVSIKVSPSVTICKGISVTLTASGAQNYTWTGGVVDGAPFTPTVTATYTVKGKDQYQCEGTASQEIKVFSCNGETGGPGGGGGVGIVETATSLQEITIYPNPTNGLSNISVKNANFKELSVTVVDMLGTEVFAASDKNNSTDYNLEINLENLSKGLYYLRISAGTDAIIKKLIVQ